MALRTGWLSDSLLVKCRIMNKAQCAAAPRKDRGWASPWGGGGRVREGWKQPGRQMSRREIPPKPDILLHPSAHSDQEDGHLEVTRTDTVILPKYIEVSEPQDFLSPVGKKRNFPPPCQKS